MATSTVVSHSIALQELSGLPQSSRSRSPRPDHINELAIEPVTCGDEQSPLGRHHLPPVDRGAGAYKLLFGAFVFEALLWGKHGRMLGHLSHALG